MQSEVEVLTTRIKTLENLIGSPRKPRSESLQKTLQAVHIALRQQVPDEITDAKRAVTMLTRATPRLPAAARIRTSQALAVEQTVDETIRVLEEMTQLVKSLDAFQIADVSLRAPDVAALETRIVADLAPGLDEEDAALDGLLMDFNDSTARLNHHIVMFADSIRQRE